MFKKTLLVCSYVLLATACTAKTQKLNNIHYLTGAYPSHIVSIYPTEAKTEFFIDANGAQAGKYSIFEHQQLKLEGKLEDFKVLDAHTVIASWRDQYGTGKLKMKFSPDFSSFEGKWLPDQFRFEDETQWNMVGIK
ncbi:MAG: hypothetical protein ACSHWN_02880 [Methylophilaceae bacterium]